MVFTRKETVMLHAFERPQAPSPAAILRQAFQQAQLQQLGGEPLDRSGFEDEAPEPDFDETE
jgi:hypothetical protein